MFADAVLPDSDLYEARPTLGQHLTQASTALNGNLYSHRFICIDVSIKALLDLCVGATPRMAFPSLRRI